MTTAFSTEAAAALPGPAWLTARRREAADRLSGTPLPSTDEEVWRYSRIGDLDLDAFGPAADAPQGPAASATEVLAALTGDETLVVTRNGRVVSVRLSPKSSAVVTAASDAVDSGPIGQVAGSPNDAFGLLNDAFSEPVVVSVPDGVDGGRVVVVHTFEGSGVAAFDRLVVAVGAAANLTVVEVFVSDDESRILSVPVTELAVGRDAILKHGTVQVLGAQTWQIARVASSVDAGGNLSSGAAAFGGDYARVRVDTELAGRGAHGEISAAYFGDGSQLLDFRTFQDHVAPDTTSNLMFKGALAGHGASVYTGLIKIRPGARGARAFQTNRNLKLSDDAWAESVPNLEIENNEVQCSHASTVGPVDAEQLFYLESRGVPTDRAERLVVRGFFDDVLAGLPVGSLDALIRARLDAELEGSLLEGSR